MTLPRSSARPRARARPRASARPLLLAHRGDHRRHPENTLAAFSAGIAIERVDGLELDVRASADGVAIVLHDETLERVQHRAERAADLSAEQLAILGVPRLADVLAACRPPAFLDVELKEDLGAAALALLRMARGRPDGSLERAVVSSFDVGTLATVRRLAPAVACWLNVSEPVTEDVVGSAVDLGCRGISVAWRHIDARAAALARGAGLEVAAWTVTDRAILERVVALGVDAVCVEGGALPG